MPNYVDDAVTVHDASLAMPSKARTSAAARASGPRVPWVDHAKGICIFFVVMLHVNDLSQEWTHEMGWLEEVVEFARPFRMPDFFLIAGLFLAAAMRRPWRRYLDVKVVHFLYFYVLWMTLQFLIVDLKHLVRAEDASVHGVALIYLKRWIEPPGALWFIHILPVFFVVTRFVRGVPPWLIWLVAAGLHSLQYKIGWKVVDELGARYVYFFSGYILAPHLFRVAAWAYERAGVALGYLACWGVVNGILVAVGWALWPGVSLALGYAGALAVIFAAALLSKLPWTRPLSYLGQHSIVVYLSDWAVSIVVVRSLALAIGDVGSLALAATAVTIVGTIVGWRIALRTPGRFMYVRPRWLRLGGITAPADRSGDRS